MIAYLDVCVLNCGDEPCGRCQLARLVARTQHFGSSSDHAVGLGVQVSKPISLMSCISWRDLLVSDLDLM